MRVALTHHQSIQVAARAGCALRTVIYGYRGDTPLRSTTRARLEMAARELGLPPPPPLRVEDEREDSAA